MLGSLNALSLLNYANNARRLLGKTTATWYILFQASQFHIIYYASRPLPNMFAFVLSKSHSQKITYIALIPFIATTALSSLIQHEIPVKAHLNRLRLAVFILTLTAIIFRSEIAILLVCYVGNILVKLATRFNQLSPAIALLKSAVIPAGILGVVVGLCMTIPIDTFFWQSPTYLWSEYSAFVSNIFPTDSSLGASAWGTQPWNWYYSNALPRILMNPCIYLILWLTAVNTSATWEQALDLLLPDLGYIAVYSVLPHKETRFIFPVIPPLTLAGALSASYIWTRRHRTLFYRLMSMIIVFSTIISALIAHAVLLPLSALSYPGAHALNSLHDHVSALAAKNTTQGTNTTISVHLDNLSTQTGITRFLQHPVPTEPGDDLWIYDKSENATDLLDPFWWEQFDYAIMESPTLAIGSWDVVSAIYGLGRFRVLRLHEKRETDSQQQDEKALGSSGFGIDEIATQMYGFIGKKAAVAARQLLWEGHGARFLLGRQWSWTRGWWVDIEWTPKLYILRRQKPLAIQGMEELSPSHAQRIDMRDW